MDKVKVKLTKNCIVWDAETGIVVDNSGMYDREGKALDAIPLTDFINRKLREGILEIVKEKPVEVLEDASNSKPNKLSDKDKKQVGRSRK